MMRRNNNRSVEEVRNARMNGHGIDLSTIDTSLPDEKTSLSTKMSSRNKKKMNRRKKIIIFSIIGAILVAGGVVLAIFLMNQKSEPEEAKKEEKKPKKSYYSVLTGEEIADKKLNESPTYCMQIPNGTDGARPQVGLNKAGVVFEAVAEAGITRFAAVFQNTEQSVIGPIRSLRLYYLDWDVPFDCTIVHAGGSGEAIAAATSYKDLTESNEYMWRINKGYVAPNNLFTSSELLSKFAEAKGYNTSDVKAFSRLKPSEAKKIAEENIAAASEGSSDSAKDKDLTSKENMHEIVPLVKEVHVNFGGVPAFNTVYKYDEKTNSYLRSYGDGSAHISYDCDAGVSVSAPKKDCGEPKQISPKAVAVMMVDQWLDTDRYHLRTQTIGTGDAYVFQNGQAVKGTWTKSAREDQIVFKDAAGEEIKFTPGQLWIAAVPNSTGTVRY